MKIDKSWMSLKNRACNEYEKGIDTFLDLAFKRLGNVKRIRCPCAKCYNVRLKCRKEVKYDLFRNGILQSYTKWDHHGELSDESSSDSDAEDANIPIDDGCRNMETMLEDLFGHIGNSTTTDIDDRECTNPEDPIPEAQNYYRLLEECKQDLYPGCERHSKLSFLVHLLNLKCLNGWTDKSVTMLLEFFIDLLPNSANIPKSYYEARKIIKDLGLDYVKIDACKNDCVLFWKKLANNDTCPTCGESRWILNNGEKKTISKKRKQIPHKILRYFPLTSRLQRLYMNKEMATNMRWHSDARQNDGILRHPADSLAWKHFDHNHHEFAIEPRNVRLGLASDGFNPFGNMSTTHSVWPVILVPYNLPPWLCMKNDNFIISLLIPGPKAPGNDIDVYLEPLVDELNNLWKEGVTTYDASKKKNFTMRAALLWTINDFPAYANLSGWSTKGKLACPCCNKDTVSMRLKYGKKFCYMGHRRFLSHNHKWRNEKKSFDGTKENRLAPKTLSGEEVLEQLSQMKQVTFGKVNNKRKRSQQQMCYLNWRKHSIFFNLPYWHTLLIRHNLDVMHVEKNNGDNVFGTLMNIDGKSKDTLNARKDLMVMGLRKELHLIPMEGKEMATQNEIETIASSKAYKMPSAYYTLSKDERQLFCQFLLDLKLPDGFSSNISRCVNKHEGKLQNLKSHDIHCLLHRHLPLGIRGLLRKDVSNALIEFSAYFRELCSKSLRVSDLERLENSIALTLCKLERIFPPTFFDIMVHLSIHLATEAKITGPVQYRWMYPFERYLRTLKSYVRNKARPEGSIAEGIIAQECVTFCSKYLHDVETRLNRVGRNYEGDPTQKSSSLAIFSQCGFPLSNSKIEQLTTSDWMRAAMCVLKNCKEVLPYIREHIEEVQSKYGSDIERQHEEQFVGWFQAKIAEMFDNQDKTVSQELLHLARGPDKRVNKCTGYLINGFRFHTKEHENFLKTQNSGVFVHGDDGLSNKEYYGLILDIIELQYQGSKKIALFKCHWWDVYNYGRGYKEDENGFFLVNVDRELSTNTTDPYILASQARQVYYAKDIRDPKWLVVVKTQPRDIYDVPIIENNVNDQEECASIPIQENENIGDFYRIVGDSDNNDLCILELARANVQEIVFDESEHNISGEANEEDLLNCNNDDNGSFLNET